MDGIFGRKASGSGNLSRSAERPWPAGEYWVQESDLPWLLLGAAQDNAVRALSLYVSSNRLDQLQAAVAVGAAVELAAKACLASIEPALLAEKANVDAVLRLTGHPDLSKAPATDIRTVGGVEACRHAKNYGRAVVAKDDDVARAMRVRNSATHMALVDQAELRSSVPAMARIVDSLVIEMEEDRAAFWGDRLAFVDELIAQRLREVHQIVSAKLAAARLRVEALTRGLNEDTKRLLLAARSINRVSSDYEEPTKCPVCGQEAWLICGFEYGDPDDDDDGFLHVPRLAVPFSLDCSVCDLWLDGEDELAVLDLDTEIELDGDDYDPADRTGDY